MRWINKIIVHCTDTPFGKDFSAEDVDHWHKEKGWRKIGYHYLIRLDGRIEKGRSESEVGAHCLGQNLHSIGVCYVGGRDKNGNFADTRTDAQKESMNILLYGLVHKYKGQVFGHRDFANRACPCFDAKSEYYYLYDDLRKAL